MSEEVVKAICQIEGLVKMDFRQCDLNAESLEHLAATGIKELGFRLQRPDELSLVANIKSLQDLTLSGNYRMDRVPVTAADLRPLADLGLTSIAIGPFEMNADTCVVFGEFTGLGKLTLHYPTVEILKACLEHESIIEYTLMLQPMIADKCIIAMKEADHLRNIMLSMSPITDVGLEALSEMSFLQQVYLNSGLISEKGKKAFERKMDHLNFPIHTWGEMVNESESRQIHELASQGLAAWSMGPQNSFFVFQKDWIGAEESVIEIIKMKCWDNLQIDIPLTDAIVDAMINFRTGKQIFVVFDSGQHPEGGLDRLREEYEFKPFAGVQRSAMPATADGEAFIVKKK